MATFQLALDDQKMQDAQHEGALLPLLIEATLNQVLRVEMTEHLGAAPGERTVKRQGYRNGSYRRELTTRVGNIELEVPRGRAGTFQTELFERYQRSEKALVLSLMEMVVQGVSTRKVKKITQTLLRAPLRSQHGQRPGQGPRRAGSGLGRAALRQAALPLRACRRDVRCGGVIR
jgi:transposase-like protein